MRAQQHNWTLLCTALCLVGLFHKTVHCWGITNCRGIDEHDFDNERSSNTSENCYCDPVDQEDDQRRVIIRCLLGSSIDTLSTTVEKVKNSSATVWSIQVGEMDFNGQRMRDGFFSSHNITPEEFSVFSCGTVEKFTFGQESLRNAEASLKKFTVFGCKLVIVPSVVKRLRWLEVLELASDEIETLRSDDLSGLAELRTLDLSDNNMVAVEKGALRPLVKLENLLLGPGNSLGHAALDEIGASRTLRTLKMPKNHLKHLADGALAGLDNLEELDVSGNFLENLTKPMFLGLSSLKVLDLRVNLINTIEQGSFAPLINLNELYLSGNYIVHVAPATFGNLVSLKSLHLGWNEFSNIVDNSFAQLVALESLQLNNNRKLMLVEAGALNGLKNLHNLNLSSTKILTLEPSTFQATPKLETFDLSNSDVDLLDVTTFQATPKLKELYLNKTHLFTLPEGIFEPLVHLQRLDISFNPWQCNENLTWLVDWIKRKGPAISINRINDTICFWPSQLRGERLLSMDLSQMRRGEDGSPAGASLVTPNADEASAKPSSGGFFGSILSSDVDDEEVSRRSQETAASSEHADSGQSSEVGTVIIVVVVILSVLIVLTVIVIVTMMMRKRKRSSTIKKLNNGVDHHYAQNQTYKIGSGAAHYQPNSIVYKESHEADNQRTNTAYYLHDSESITHF